MDKSVSGQMLPSMSWYGGAVSQDTWHHLAYVIDSVADNGTFYIDGQFDSSFNITYFDIGTPNYIGRY